MTALATFLATALVLGFPLWLTAKRAKAAEDRAQVAWAGHQEIATDNARLRTMLASAEADLAEANRQLDNDAQIADHTATIMHAATTAIARRHWLPTIEGNYLDTVERLPVGARLDFAEFTTDTPLGLGVLSDHIADVVPIRGRSK